MFAGVSPTPPSSLEARLDRLERALAAISGEITAIRSELHASRPPVSPTAETPMATDAPASRPASVQQPRRPGDRRRNAAAVDFERLVGRYGMLGIAVVAAVAAVGTFLSWAIRAGYLRLDPPERVLVGLAVAAALGAWGLRLRRRERSFGSSILGLALVIVQVCAYAAGPGFHLVPTVVAFGGAAIVSWTLAIFAHGENDEPLWCVGFGGAALSPFVTSDGTGNVYALLGYGVLVLLPACFAISGRLWPVAWRVFYAVSALYVLAGAELGHRAGTWPFLTAFALPFVVAAAGVVPFAPIDRKRAALRWLGVLGVAASLWTPAMRAPDAWYLAAALLAGAGLWLFLIDRQATTPQSSLLARTRESFRLLDGVDAGLVPLALVYEAVDAIPRGADPLVIYVIAAALFVAFAWRRAVNTLRDAAALAAAVCGAGVVASLPLELPLGRLTGFVVLSLLLLAAHRARPSMSWLFAGLVALFFTALSSAMLLAGRHAYGFTPFVTEPSAGAAVVLVGMIAVARLWQALRTATRAAMGDQPEWTYASGAQLLLRAVTIAPWVWAFAWGFLELSMAHSASTSTLLVVTYFAATAVGCVGVGRARRSARLRQTGLFLAIAAAVTAFYGATTWFDLGTRIAAYLVTSAFLLGIAYWYRRPGGLATAESAGDATA